MPTLTGRPPPERASWARLETRCGCWQYVRQRDPVPYIVMPLIRHAPADFAGSSSDVTAPVEDTRRFEFIGRENDGAQLYREVMP